MSFYKNYESFLLGSPPLLLCVTIFNSHYVFISPVSDPASSLPNLTQKAYILMRKRVYRTIFLSFIIFIFTGKNPVENGNMKKQFTNGI